MTTLVKVFIFFVISQTVLFAQNNTAQDITVKVNNLNSNNGKVYVSLYNSETSFLDKGFKATFTAVENNSCEVTFKDVPEGIYAISLFHDENQNNKMDSNFLGIPKEDYGCSNNARGFMGPPKWEDAKFEVKNGQHINQQIKL